MDINITYIMLHIIYYNICKVRKNTGTLKYLETISFLENYFR